jgi:hypothetical protein
MKLLIYIPTYNRNKLLYKQIDIISQEPELNSGFASLIINDNKSFEQINISRYQSKNIFFNENISNIGGNANISLGFLLSKNYDYLWILSDNDTIKKGSLSIIKKEILSDFKFDLLVFDANHKEKSDYLIKSNESFDLLNTGALDLISNTIYSTKSISNFIESAFYFHNSSFPHLAIILSKLKNDKSIKVRAIQRGLIHDFEKNLIHDYEKKDTSMFNGYGFAIAGYPLLLHLMEDKIAEKYAISWTKKWGVSFFYNYKNFPLNSAASFGVLKNIKSFKLKYLLITRYLYACAYRKHIKLLKIIFPKKLLTQFSKIAGIYFGKVH